MTDCVICRLCSMPLRTDRACLQGKGGTGMELTKSLARKNQLQWLLSGALSTSLALCGALGAHAQQSGAAAQQTPTPGQQGDWGQAGPPPDAQNGQIPAPDSAAQGQDNGGNQGANQGGTRSRPGAAAIPQSGSGPEPISESSAQCCERPGSGVWAGASPSLSAQSNPAKRVPGSPGRGATGPAPWPSHVEQRNAFAGPHQ